MIIKMGGWGKTKNTGYTKCDLLRNRDFGDRGY